jgi:hypothetical protein
MQRKDSTETDHLKNLTLYPTCQEQVTISITLQVNKVIISHFSLSSNHFIAQSSLSAVFILHFTVKKPEAIQRISSCCHS